MSDPSPRKKPRTASLKQDLSWVKKRSPHIKPDDAGAVVRRIVGAQFPHLSEEAEKALETRNDGDAAGKRAASSVRSLREGIVRVGQGVIVDWSLRNADKIQELVNLPLRSPSAHLEKWQTVEENDEPLWDELAVVVTLNDPESVDASDASAYTKWVFALWDEADVE